MKHILPLFFVSFFGCQTTATVPKEAYDTCMAKQQEMFEVCSNLYSNYLMLEEHCLGEPEVEETKYYLIPR